MADDITLTVRVRDLSRGELARINQQVNRLRQNFRNAGNSANSTSRNFRSLGQDISRVGSRFRQMAQNGQLTQRALQSMNRDLDLVSRGLRNAARNGDITRNRFRAMSRDVDQLRARMVLVGRQGNVFNRLSAHLTLFQGRLRESNNHAGRLRRTLSNMGGLGLGGLRGVSNGLALLLAGLSRMGNALKANKRWAAILIATLLLIGPAAQALGALLVAALGGAFIALGAFALRGNAQVKSAFQDMKSSVGSSVRAAAQPLEGALVGAMANVTVAVKKMQPALAGTFAATAPLVDKFIGSFTDLGARALPGITASLSQAGPAMDGFRTAMGEVGQGIGDMFKAMTANGGAEALGEVWIHLGDEIRNLLVGVGEFINMAAKSETATMLLVSVFRSFSGALNLVEGGLRAVDAIFGGLFSHLSSNLTGFAQLTGTMDKLGTSFTASGKDLGTLKKELKDVTAEIKEMERIRKEADSSGLEGSAKSQFLADSGASDTAYQSALEKRRGLLAAITAAEDEAAGATSNHARSVRELVAQIQSLADLNRNYLDAQAAQQQAMIDATAKQGEFRNALKMVDGQLDLTSEAGINAYEMLSKIAQNTSEATTKAQEANAPWQQIQANWQSGYEKIVALADGMGLSAEQAKALATQILGMPPAPEISMKVRTDEAIAGLNSVMTAFRTSPSSKTVTVKALTHDAVVALQDLGFKVTRMQDGRFKITASTADAKANIGVIQRLRDALKNKTITLSAYDAITGKARAAYAAVQALHSKTITLTTVHRNVDGGGGRGRNAATGGLIANIPRRASGGAVQAIPNGGFVQGPGGTTTDSILAMLPSGPVRVSDSEYVMRATAVKKYGVGFLNALNAGRLPKFARGGVTKSERSARNSVRGDLTVSRFGTFAGSKNSEFISSMTKASSLQGLVDDLNKMRSTIKKTTHGLTESRLLRQLDSAGKSLLKYQKNLTSVNKSLEKARDKLNDLKTSASQLREGVKNTILGETDVTKSAGAEDSQVTINTIMSQMAANSGQAKQFEEALKTLRKKGLSGDLIEQIASAGLSGGGLETANAILGADPQQIKQLNSMQRQIKTSATNSGKTAADAMYAAGIKAAEGLVKGLEMKKKSIEKAMMRIAKAMEKAIKKALGIKSPSRVMQQVGHYTAEGFAVGIEKNKKPAHSWDSMLTVRKSGGAQYTPQRVGSGEPMVIQLNIGGTSIGEILIDPLRKSIRHRGGNVQAVLGK
jgi:hypothetical protein